MNDWIHKLNYAATFRTAGVRMRGHMGVNHEARLGSKAATASEMSTQTETSGHASIPVHAHTLQLSKEILAYRHRLMIDKIWHAGQKLDIAQKELDNLLRNARHLQILAPIQAKTREAVVLAAGRMSAKLKWTRVEMWRTRCHRDILKQDIEEETKDIHQPWFPDHMPLITVVSQLTPTQVSQARLHGAEPRTIDLPASPKSTTSTPKFRRTSPSVAEGPKSPVVTQQPSSNRSPRDLRHTPSGSVAVPSIAGSIRADPGGEIVNLANSSPGSHTLDHQASSVSSNRRSSDLESHRTVINVDLDEVEEQVLREAGIFGFDGSSASASKRPDTSESDLDRVRAPPPLETTPSHRGGMRRNLQRTLREPHHGPHLPHHHRSKKARESNSSVGAMEDGTKSVEGDSDGLTRGTGSFIVHGKKASVVTFGSEWQAMSNEERVRMRKTTGTTDEDVLEDGTESNVVVQPSAISGDTAVTAEAMTRMGPNSTVISATVKAEKADGPVGERSGREDGSLHVDLASPKLGTGSPRLQASQV